MTASIPEPTPARRKSVALERTYAATRELVFSLFTDPAHLTRWWVPYALTNPICEFDARPGGAIRFVMQAPDGKRFLFEGTVHEVEAPSRLVFTTIGLNDVGDPHIEARQTITFTEREGKTVVRVQIEVVEATEAGSETFTGMTVGWMQDLGRLEFYLLSLAIDNPRPQNSATDETTLAVTLPSDSEIMVTRAFDASRALVFKAIVDPAMKPIWWGPPLQNGKTDEPRGEYFSVVPQELAVNAFEFVPTEGYVGIDAVHLLERNGRTRLTGISLFPSKEERDRALQAGLVRDATETYARLAASLTARA